MDITFEEVGENLYFSINYNTDVYEVDMIESLMQHYKQLLSELLANPDQSIGTVNYLSKEEAHELLYTFNDTKVAYPTDKTMVDLFEDQVAKTPDNIAVVYEEIELSYKELDDLSNQLAHYLQGEYQIETEDLIGIKLDRSEWMIVSILGVLKTGGAYVPIDPEYPQERIEYIEQDSNCKVSIDASELERFKESQDTYSTDKLITELSPNNLAYVIYTSGSTGKPKGVMVEQRSLMNYLQWGLSNYLKKPDTGFDFGLFTPPILVFILSYCSNIVHLRPVWTSNQSQGHCRQLLQHLSDWLDH